MASTCPCASAGSAPVETRDGDELDVDALGGEEAEIGGDEERSRREVGRRHQLDVVRRRRSTRRRPGRADGTAGHERQRERQRREPTASTSDAAGTLGLHDALACSLDA